jgi:hypothetical protein
VFATGSVTRRSGNASVFEFKLPVANWAGTGGALVRVAPNEIG